MAECPSEVKHSVAKKAIEEVEDMIRITVQRLANTNEHVQEIWLQFDMNHGI